MSSSSEQRTQASDPMEASGVELRGTVLHRDKVVSRFLAVVMLLGTGLFSLAALGVFSGADPSAPRIAGLLPLALAMLFGYVGLTKCVVRTAVTTEEICVQLGMRVVRVSLSSVLSAELVAATKQALLGSEMIGPTAGTHVAMIEWKDSDGSTKRYAIGAEDPKTLVETVRTALPNNTGVRAQTTEASAENEALSKDYASESSTRSMPTN